MSIVMLASAKGSPGVTTTALALASWWPRPLIVMEADPAGGDMAARLGMSEEPGLVGLAAARRRIPQGQSGDGRWIADHVQRTSTGLQVVVAPAGLHQTSSALSLLCDASLPPLPERTDLLLDIGRFSEPEHTTDDVSTIHRSAVWTKANSSDLFVWICRPQLADLAHLAAILHQRRSDRRRQAIVLCGAGPYPATEVAATLNLPVIGHLPTDQNGTAALWNNGGRTWARSALGRASKSLVEAINAGLSKDDEEVIGVGMAVAEDTTESDHSLLPESIRSLL